MICCSALEALPCQLVVARDGQEALLLIELLSESEGPGAASCIGPARSTCVAAGWNRCRQNHAPTRGARGHSGCITDLARTTERRCNTVFSQANGSGIPCRAVPSDPGDAPSFVDCWCCVNRTDRQEMEVGIAHLALRNSFRSNNESAGSRAHEIERIAGDQCQDLTLIATQHRHVVRTNHLG